MWTNPRYRELTGREARPAPPVPTGKLLARFPRHGTGGLAELRVVLDSFEGHEFIGLRVWQRDNDGSWWPMRGKGVSVRLSEAEGVAEALLAAREAIRAESSAGGT